MSKFETLRRQAYAALRKAARVPNSVALCLRFPFLYPRNRFTGLHYNWWRLQRLIKKLREDGERRFTVRKPMDGAFPAIAETSCAETRTLNAETLKRRGPDGLEYDGRNGFLSVWKEKSDGGWRCPTYKCLIQGSGDAPEEYVLSDGGGTHRPLWFGAETYIYDEKLRRWQILDKERRTAKVDAEIDNSEEKLRTLSVRVVVDRRRLVLAAALEWIHDWPLAFLHCVPASTELDAMDDGWRKAFGVKMCSDIKRQLIKDRQLFSFRVAQIKEKWGELCFYTGGCSKEVYDIIDRYSGLSARICIACGKPAKYRTTGWVLPYCEDCCPESQKASADVWDAKAGKFVRQNIGGENESEEEDGV